MCPQFRCNYHSACTIRAFLSSSHQVSQLLRGLEWKGHVCPSWNNEKDELSERVVFLGRRSVQKASSPALISCLSGLSAVGFCWQGKWQRGYTGPIRRNLRLCCMLTLGDLISWIRGRAKTKEAIMIAVSYYGIDLLTQTNTHTKTHSGLVETLKQATHMGAAEMNRCRLPLRLPWKLS